MSEGFGLRGKVYEETETAWDRRHRVMAPVMPTPSGPDEGIREPEMGRGLSKLGWALSCILSFPAVGLLSIPAVMKMQSQMVTMVERYPDYPRGVPPTEIMSLMSGFAFSMVVLVIIQQIFLLIQFSRRMYDTGLSRSTGVMIYLGVLAIIPIGVITFKPGLLVVWLLAALGLFVWGLLAPRTN